MTEKDGPNRSEAHGKTQFRPDIEGLRAVAVLAVVFFHFDIPGIPITGGFVGVDVFFVISGFLITGLLWREVTTTGGVRLRRFYGARARRLLPASAMVGVTIMILWTVLHPLKAPRVIGDGIASALYVSNYRFVLQDIDYLTASAPSPFQHYWSLGVEEQFYLVWPPLIVGAAWLVRRRRRRSGISAESAPGPFLLVLASVAAVSFSASWVATRAAPPIAFFSLPTRAWELAMGGLVALTVNKWRRVPAVPAAIAGWAGLGAILLACNQFGVSTPYPGTAALVPVLGTALVIGTGCAAPIRGVGRVLSLTPLQAIGRASYSWYLWHWPIALLVTPWSTAAGLAGILISGGLAALTLRLVENPIRFAAPVRRSPTRSLAIGGGVTAAAVCVGLVLLITIPAPVGHGPPARPISVSAAPLPHGLDIERYRAAVSDTFAQVNAAVVASTGLRAVPSNLDPPLARLATSKTQLASPEGGCMRNLLDVDQPECATGDGESATTVALIGDSHAAMWAPALQEVATQRRWRLESLTKAACPLVDQPVYNYILRRPYTECQDWRDEIVTRLRTEHPKLVVLGIRRGIYAFPKADRSAVYEFDDQAWNNSLSRLVQLLRDTGAKVLVLGPVPNPHSSVPDCLSRHLKDATDCAASRASAVNESGIRGESAATKDGGGQYADLTRLFCADEQCPAIVGNTLVYRDSDHLTAEYAKLLGPVIGTLADFALHSN